jgi:hypothetical protein
MLPNWIPRMITNDNQFSLDFFPINEWRLDWMITQANRFSLDSFLINRLHLNFLIN